TLPRPEPGLLTLDHPASGPAEVYPLVFSAEVAQPEHGDEALLLLGVDVRDHLDVRLEARAAQLRLEQAVDLVDAGRVVHPDLDHDRPLLAVRDRDLLDCSRRERMDADLAALERDARAALGHVE